MTRDTPEAALTAERNDRPDGRKSKGEPVDPREAPDQTATASDRAREVVAAFETLSAKDGRPDNAKHLWSLSYSMVADIHRGLDNYPKDSAKP